MIDPLGNPTTNPYLTQIIAALAGTLGGGAAVNSWINRKSIRSADDAAKLQLDSDNAEDKSRADFREELRKMIQLQDVQIGVLRGLHENCEKQRSIDKDKYVEDKIDLLSKVRLLSDQVEFFRSIMNSLKKGIRPATLKALEEQSRSKAIQTS